VAVVFFEVRVLSTRAACFRHVGIGVEGRETAPQAVSVRCEGDSLRDPAEVERGVEMAVVDRQQDQGYRGVGEVPGVLAQVAQALLDCLVCDDPESPELAVPGRSGPAGNVEDLVDLLTGYWPVGEVTDRTEKGQELQQGHSRSLYPSTDASRPGI
jgi:hypothetical protein